MYKKDILLISFLLILGIGSVSGACIELEIVDQATCNNETGTCNDILNAGNIGGIEQTGYMRFENIPLGSIVHNLTCHTGATSDRGAFITLYLLNGNPSFDVMTYANSDCRWGCRGTNLGTQFVNMTADAPDPIWDLSLIIDGNKTFALTDNNQQIDNHTSYDGAGDVQPCSICYSSTSCSADSECNDTENIFCQQAESYCLMNNMEINITDTDLIDQDVTVSHDNWIGSELYGNTTNMTLDRNRNWGDFETGYKNANTRVSTWFDGFARFGNVFGYQANAFDNTNDKIGQSNIDYAIMTEGTLNLTIQVYFEHNPTQGIDNVTVYVNNVDVVGFNRTDYTDSDGSVTFYNMGAGEYELDLQRAGLKSVNTYTFMYFENETKNVYMFLDYNDVWFNLTTFDAGDYSEVETVALEFADYGNTILNYPEGAWTPITTRYTNESGQFIGSVTDTPECFVIGFKKSGYFTPKTSGVHINVKEICLIEGWYDNDTQRYNVPYFDYYMIPETDDLNLTLIIRSADTYATLSGATINAIAPSGILYSDTSDANGEMEIIDMTGCYQFSVSMNAYSTVNIQGCFWNKGTFDHTIFIMEDVTHEDANITEHDISGYTLNTTGILPYTDVNLHCLLEASGGQDLLELNDVTRSNGSAQFLFEDIRQNFVCVLIASKNGYDDGSTTVTVDDDITANITMSYTGLTYSVDGYVTDCATGDGLNARIEWYDCSSGFDTCQNLRSSVFSDSTGYYKINGVDEGFNKFFYHSADHESIFEFDNTNTNEEINICLPTELPRYWIRGIVLNRTEITDTHETFNSIEATVRVFLEGDNAVINLMDTNIDGRFAFYLRMGRYTLTAEAGNSKGEETFLVNHDFGQDEARIILGLSDTVEQEETEKEFISTLYAIVPSILVIFIFLMLIAGLKNATR